MRSERWQLAQDHERRYWDHEAGGIAAGEIGDLGWYRSRAEALLALVSRMPDRGLGSALGSSVVEVGCGPVGAIRFLEAPTRTAVDPLNDFYATRPEFTALREGAVRYLSGRGEELPLDDVSVDTLICENALDHVEDPARVLGEFARVIRPGGRLLLRVEVFEPLGAAIHWILAHTRLDPLHPHTFTARGVRSRLHALKFTILQQEITSYAEARQCGLASPSRRARLLARVGMNAVVATFVAQKP